MIDRERAGHYLGQTVQYMPHIIDEIKKRVFDAAEDYEIAIIEVGGIVGDYENTPYFFSLKSIEREIGSENMAYVLVTYLPVPEHLGEMKIRPTRQALRLLGEEGILPDFIICRSKYSIDSVRAKKFEEFANVPSDRVISAPDVQTIYQIPLDLEQEQFGLKILKQLHLEPRQQPDWTEWARLVDVIRNPQKKITIAIVGKYLDVGNFSLTDSYLSIYQALIHAAAQQNYGVTIKWIDAKQYEQNPELLAELNDVAGIIVPGGFGSSGVEGKMKAIEYARINNIPYLGLCYGMHLAAVEFARNVCGMADAHTTEVAKDTQYPIVDILPLQKELLEQKYFGGTMRLGSYDAILRTGSKVAQLYKGATLLQGTDEIVTERHRHRYEMNPMFVPALEAKGLVFSGHHNRQDGTQLMEYLELPNHTFFVATQAHPEFKSRLGHPNPLFAGFIKAAMTK